MQLNYISLDKTDEVDLFFGKVGYNKIQDVDTPLKVYQYWTENVLKLTAGYHARFLEENVIQVFTRVAYNSFVASPSNRLDEIRTYRECTDQMVSRHKVSYLAETLSLLEIVVSLQCGDLKQAIEILRQKGSALSATTEKRFDTQTYGFGMTLLTLYLTKNLSEETKFEQVPTVRGLIFAFSRSAGNLDKNSPVNCVSAHTKLASLAFKESTLAKKHFLKKAMAALRVHSEVKFYKLVAVMCFFTGDMEQGCKILNRVCKPRQGVNSPIDLLLFQLHLLSASGTQLSNQFTSTKERLKDFEITKV